MFFRKNRQTKTAQVAAPKTATWHKPGGTYDVLANEALKAEHTLIAGYTGCGKSTFLRSIVQAALVRFSPATAKLIIIDPKQTDLENCADLPHTVCYADDLDKANKALATACEMMSERNRIRREQGTEVYEGSALYILIDELNPILTDKNDRQRSKMSQFYIEQIVSLGRAANVHLIACTQNPNKATLPANISDNCTCRFGLHCMTDIQSRQIILKKGCEMLPIHGETLAIIGGVLGRYVLPYVTQADIRPLIEYWKSPSAVTYGY